MLANGISKTRVNHKTYRASSLKIIAPSSLMLADYIIHMGFVMSIIYVNWST